MEVENPSLPSFDMQSKPPFPFDSMLSSQECGTSETVLALTAAVDALQYESSEPSFGQNPVDAPEYKRSEPWVALDEEVKSATMDVQECATSETVVALSPGVNSATINALENGRSDSMAALKLQKVYRSYRTRRKLADSAVVAEELWWQGIDFARLNHSTISFFNFLKPETAASRWNRISLNASKVGKGLSKDANAQKLAFQHWIEAIDPRHRYGHSLHLYYEEWCKTDAGQPFFYWLDIGDGKEVDLEECPRSKLRQQCIKYLGPQERKHYEYIVVEGKIIHKQTEKLLDTNQGSQGAKWIFVMSTSKKLYAGVKKKGLFHHSSFLAGGATLAAGRLVAENGVLKAISGYSGHYRPTEENLDSFLALLKDKGVNLNEDQIRSSTEDYNYEDIKSVQEESRIGVPKHSMSPQLENPFGVEKTQLFQPTEVPQNEPTEIAQTENRGSYRRTLSGGLRSPRADVPKIAILQRINSNKAASSYQLGHQLSLKWSTGAGPRIGCIADYPLELRVQALEFVNLSPRVLSTPSASRQPGSVDSPTSPSTSDFCNGDGTSTA